MATVSQLVRNCIRKVKRRRYRIPLLFPNCMRRGVCKKVTLRTPRKPNSALRKVAQVELRGKRRRLLCYIPGEKHNLRVYSMVLVRGGRTKDLPGAHCKLVRGKYDFAPVVGRRRGRSKYGARLLIARARVG